jgi:hypothetical protein
MARDSARKEKEGVVMNGYAEKKPVKWRRDTAIFPALERIHKKKIKAGFSFVSWMKPLETLW